MFLLTLRKGGIKKAAAVALCCAVLGGGVIGVSALAGRQDAEEAAAKLTEPVSKIASADNTAAFFKGYGVEIDLASTQVNAVKVPKKWDDSFKAFNEVIKEGGLDLSKSKGKKVDKWMAVVPSLCQNEEKVYAVVLVYKEKPVGAYLIAKPSGNVSALKAVSASAPLTQEEMEANADFGSNVETVNDSVEMEANAALDDAAANVVPEGAVPTE